MMSRSAPRNPYEVDDPPCDVCGRDPYDCECPECPECGAAGDLKCYSRSGHITTQLDRRTQNMSAKKKNTNIHTMPQGVLNQIRAADALCACGRPADEHINRLGPCAETGCGRWTWAPAPEAATITAVVTARGVDSTVPDNAEAVDATIYVNGEEIGNVTLQPDHTGRLATWGEPSNWADDALLRYAGDRLTDLASEVVAAVREAV